MIRFIYHELIEKQITATERRFRKIREGFSSFERLCEVQFNPNNPKQIIAPAKLHRITQNNLWCLWKIELVIPNSGLKPNQFPRVWFVVKGDVVAFLCFSSHIENYNDEEMNNLALQRIGDLI